MDATRPHLAGRIFTTPLLKPPKLYEKWNSSMLGVNANMPHTLPPAVMHIPTFHFNRGQRNAKKSSLC